VRLHLATTLLVLLNVVPSSGVVTALRCIKHHESDCCGGWAASTGDGYFGGLQMNSDFERTYGPLVSASSRTCESLACARPVARRCSCSPSTRVLALAAHAANVRRLARRVKVSRPVATVWGCSSPP
jgi:hypothetical protein